MYALEKGESMAFIIDNAINVSDANEKDLKGSSLLMYACSGGYMKAVKQLIEEGADINAMDMEGYAPLSMAFNNNNLDVVEYLIKLNVLKQGNIRRKDEFNKLKKRIKENKRSKKEVELQDGFGWSKGNRFVVENVDRTNKMRSKNSRTNLRRK